MASLFTQFKNALGLPVSYAEVDLGADGNGVPKRVPQSAPSDAAGAPLYAAGVIPALDGADATGVTPPTGGAGLRGWLSGIYAKLSGTLTVQGTVTVTDGSGPLTVDGTVGLAAGTLTGLAQDGTDATGVTPPAGAVGIRGWLSAIYAKLPALANGKIPVDIGGESIVISGNVTIPGSVEISNDAGNAIPVSAAQLPASLGQKAGAQSLPVVLSSDGPFATNFGLTTDAAATSGAGTFGFIALFKRSLGYLGTLAGAVSAGIVQVATRSNAPRVTATGPLAAVGNPVTLALDGMSTAVVQLSGAWAGTVAWLASVDGGASYFPVSLIPYAGGAAVGSTAGNGQWEFACGGLTHLQAQMTAFTSGSATVLIAAANAAKSVRVGAPAAQPVPVQRVPLTFTTAFSGALTASWQKVTTTTTATKGLRIGIVGAPAPSAYDIEWTAVAAGSAAPTDTFGEGVGGGEDFAAGLPIGDIYLRSVSLQTALVKTGA